MLKGRKGSPCLKKANHKPGQNKSDKKCKMLKLETFTCFTFKDEVKIEKLTLELSLKIWDRENRFGLKVFVGEIFESFSEKKKT